MANICENQLIVSGKALDIKRFVDDFIKGDMLLFDQNIHDIPAYEATFDHFVLEFTESAALRNAERDYIADPDNKTLKEKYQSALMRYVINKDTSWEIIFPTSWEPPRSFIFRCIETYPELNFELEYLEPGMGLCGKISTDEGEVYYRNCKESPLYIYEDEEEDDNYENEDEEDFE